MAIGTESLKKTMVLVFTRNAGLHYGKYCGKVSIKRKGKHLFLKDATSFRSNGIKFKNTNLYVRCSLVCCAFNTRLKRDPDFQDAAEKINAYFRRHIPGRESKRVLARLQSKLP